MFPVFLLDAGNSIFVLFPYGFNGGFRLPDLPDTGNLVQAPAASYHDVGHHGESWFGCLTLEYARDGLFGYIADLGKLLVCHVCLGAQGFQVIVQYQK
jgi:hypothetical protein